MKDLVRHFLCQELEFIQIRLGLSQWTYIDKVLERFNKDQCPKNELGKVKMKGRPFDSALGSLIYAQMCGRPDITFMVGILGRYQSNPRNGHQVATKKVMRYFSRKPNNIWLCIDEQTTWRQQDTRFLLSRWLNDRKLTSRYIFVLVRVAISWKRKKHTMVSSSTIQVEFIVCYAATTHVIQ